MNYLYKYRKNISDKILIHKKKENGSESFSLMSHNWNGPKRPITGRLFFINSLTVRKQFSIFVKGLGLTGDERYSVPNPEKQYGCGSSGVLRNSW